MHSPSWWDNIEFHDCSLGKKACCFIYLFTFIQLLYWRSAGFTCFGIKFKFIFTSGFCWLAKKNGDVTFPTSKILHFQEVHAWCGAYTLGLSKIFNDHVLMKQQTKLHNMASSPSSNHICIIWSYATTSAYQLSLINFGTSADSVSLSQCWVSEVCIARLDGKWGIVEKVQVWCWGDKRLGGRWAGNILNGSILFDYFITPLIH